MKKKRPWYIIGSSKPTSNYVKRSGTIGIFSSFLALLIMLILVANFDSFIITILGIIMALPAVILCWLGYGANEGCGYLVGIAYVTWLPFLGYLSGITIAKIIKKYKKKR